MDDARALRTLAVPGILIFLTMAGLETLLLRHWHESAARREQ